MADFATNSGTQRAGQGEAVLIDNRQSMQSMRDQLRYSYGADIAAARIKAKRDADAQKERNDELFKLSNQQAGAARYLTPHVATARKAFNDRLLKKIANKEEIDLNQVRAEDNALKNIERLGLETGDAFDKTLLSSKEQHIDPSAYQRAYQQNLNEMVDAHLKTGAPLESIRIDNVDLMNMSLKDPRQNIYNYGSAGEEVRKMFPAQTRETTPRPGRNSMVTTGAGYLKHKPGQVLEEVDYDLTTKVLSDPRYSVMLEHGFAQQKNNPDSFYHLEDVKNQSMLKQGLITPHEYAQTNEALKNRYVQNEVHELMGFTLPGSGWKENVGINRQFAQPKAPKETHKGDVGYSELGARDLTGGQSVVFPQATINTRYPTKTTQLTPVSESVHAGENIYGQIMSWRIPPQSSMDTYNSDLVVVGLTTKPVSVTGKGKGGKPFTQTIPAGTPISSPTIPDEERQRVVKEGVVKPTFGAMIPIYSKQPKAEASSLFPDEKGDTYLSNSNMVSSGKIFRPVNMNSNSDFMKAVGNTFGRNSKGPINVRKIESDLMKGYSVDKQVGIDDPAPVSPAKQNLFQKAAAKFEALGLYNKKYKKHNK